MFGSAPSFSLDGFARCTVYVHLDVKDISRGGLGRVMLSLPNSYSLTYAAHESPTAPESAFLLGCIGHTGRTGGWGKNR